MLRIDRLIRSLRAPTRARVIALTVGAVAILPFLVALATRAGREYVPVGDIALMDLRVRDVWSSDIPLVGAYSRFGWNHPGPAAYYLLAPVSGLFGRPAWATLVANVVVQGAIVAITGLLAYRSGGTTRLLAVLALVGLAYGAMGPTMVLDAWNPDIAFPLFPLFVLLAWILACGDRRALLGVVITGTVLVQAHVGYLPLVAAASVCALPFALTRAARTWQAWRSPVTWSVLALVLLWLPPVVHELVHESNLRRLVRAQTDPSEPALGADVAAKVLAEEFRIPPPWLGGEHRLELFGNTVTGRNALWLVLPAALLIGAAVASRHRRRRGSVELLALTATLAVAGFAAIARVTGSAERYVFYWRVPLALLIVFTSLWCFWIAFDIDRFPQARRIVKGGLALIVVCASLTLSFRIVQTDRISESEALARDALAIAHDEAVPLRGVIVRAVDTSFLGVQRALVNELDRDGDDVRVDENLGFQFGYSRRATPDDVDEVWLVSENGMSSSVLAAAPGGRVVWSSSPLSAEEEHELQALQLDLWRALQRAGREDLFFQVQAPIVGFALDGVPGVTPATLTRVAELNEKAQAASLCRCAVVAFAPADAAAASASIPPEP